MHPVKQLGTALFAAMGTNTWLVSASAATECAVPAGCVPSFAGTLSVGTRWSRVSLKASITSRVAAPCDILTGAAVAVPTGGRAGKRALGARLLPEEAA